MTSDVSASATGSTRGSLRRKAEARIFGHRAHHDDARLRWPCAISASSNGSLGSDQTQVDDLRLGRQRVGQRLREREGIAAAGGARRSLPAGLVGQELDVRRDADDADAVVGRGGDQARHLRAVPVAAERDVVVVDVIARDERAAGEIGMLGVDAGVDDGHANAGAAAEVVRLGDVERADVRLQARVGIVGTGRGTGCARCGWPIRIR